MNPKEDIQIFLNQMKEKYGFLPKSDHGKDNNRVFYNTPYFGDEELTAGIETFLFSKWMATGDKISKFEHEYAKVVENKYALMVNSGSSADFLMIRAFKELYKISDGSEVICSVVGFATSYSAIILNNLVPVFIDIENNTYNYDLSKIEEKITNKTVAILNSPVLGNTANIDQLLEICSKHKITLLQDHADSLGTTWNGKELTTYAMASAVSLYVAHHITGGGHGGAISSNNCELIDIARSISKWGILCFCRNIANLSPNGACNARYGPWQKVRPEITCDHRYAYGYVGGNFQPAMDIQGAIGLEQLKKLPEIHKKRRENKERIFNLYKKYIPYLETPKVHKECNPSWFGISISTPNLEIKRKLVNHLEKSGIQTREMFAGNILCQNAFSKFGNWKEYPNANQIYERVFFVGCSPSYTEQHFQYLEEVLSKF